MRGERERIYLLDTTLLDCVRGHAPTERRESLRALGQALGDLGIDYVAARDMSHVTLTGRFGGSAGRRLTPQDGAVAVCAWPAGDARCDAASAGLNEQLPPDRSPAASAILFAMDAAPSAARGAEALRALAGISSVAGSGREAVVEIASYFDAFKADPARALAIVSEVLEAGARWIVLAETDGAGTPDEVAVAVRAATSRVPAGRLGIMAGNGRGHGVANTLAALRAGCRLAGGTLTGLGRPGGQASLATLIPTLLLNGDLARRFATRVTPGQLAGLNHATRLLDGALDGEADGSAGLPAPAARDGSTSEPSPSLAIHGSGLLPAGPPPDRASLLSRLAELGIAAPNHEAAITRLVEAIGARDRLGYGLAEAEATFELVARRAIGALPRYFSVVDFRIGLARRRDARGRLVRTADAEVVLRIEGAAAVVRSGGGGKGPVDALDRALRASLGRFQGFVRDVELADYTVRILRRGGEAVTRVTVENRNRRTGARWLTVGVAPSIVDASLEALVDGLIYCLFKAGAPA